MNRFFRVVWSVNGIVLLLILLTAGFFLMREVVRSWPSSSRQEPRVIVGEKFEEAKKEGLILQGVEYDDPIQPYGSTGYLMPVTIKTYETPKPSSDLFSANKRSKLSVDHSTYYDRVNIVFLDADFSVTRVLLDEKTFIRSFRYPSTNARHRDAETADTTIHHLTYLIAFEDSNKDGSLTEDDNADLYMSSLEGKDLFRVTSNIDVVDYSYLNPNELLISYQERSQEPEEYRKKHFARFNVKERKFEPLTSLQKAITEIEKMVIR